MLDEPSAVGEVVHQDWSPCQEISSERFVAKFHLVFAHRSAEIEPEAGDVAPFCLHHSEICSGPRSLKRTYAQAGG
jgi:hypothetical protein